MFVELSGMSWFKWTWFGLVWIDLECLLFQITEFCAQLFQLQNYFRSQHFRKSCYLQGFSLSLFTGTCHDMLMLEKSSVPPLKRPNLPMFLGRVLSPLFWTSLLFLLIPLPLSILVICGIMLLMVLNGFIGILFFVFRLKSILVSSQLFWLPKEKYGSTINESPSINGSARLVSMHGELVAQQYTNYWEIFWPYIHFWQQDMFHPSAVGVCWFIRCWYWYLLIDISPKWSGQWWFW